MACLFLICFCELDYTLSKRKAQWEMRNLILTMKKLKPL